MRHAVPASAILGQEEMKQALPAAADLSMRLARETGVLA